MGKDIWKVVRTGEDPGAPAPRRLKTHDAKRLGSVNSVRCHIHQRTITHTEPSLARPAFNVMPAVEVAGRPGSSHPAWRRSASKLGRSIGRWAGPAADQPSRLRTPPGVGRFGQPVGLLCSPNAHTQKRKEVDGHLALQRWVSRMALSLLGSANLFRPGLASERTFEHCVSPSLTRPQRQSHAPIASRHSRPSTSIRT